MSPGGHAPARAAASGAGEARALPHWCVLDTRFGEGGRFLGTWQNWRNQAQRPAVLHYVGLLDAAQAVTLVRALHAVAVHSDSALAERARELAQQCYALGDGFQRLLLNNAQVVLTLCIGDAATQLGELHMQAQQIWAQDSTWTWDKWRLKALARNCSVGARLCLPARLRGHAGDLTAAGFATVHAAADDAQPDAPFEARFAPGWHLRDQRYAPRPPRTSAPRCAVIGAGLAGASVAHALARRGWPVDVYDQAAHCAAGASGLPAGLLVAHYSQDDSPRSRLSRLGARLMLDHASHYLQEGQDWQRCGALELQLDAGPHTVPAHPTEWTAPGAGKLQGAGWEHGLASEACLWHAQAAWIKPAALVSAWMAHPGIRFHPLAAVAGLQAQTGAAAGSAGPRWKLQDADGSTLGSADLVVFANARGCVPLIHSLADAPSTELVPGLLQKLAAMQVLHGGMSNGSCAQASDLARFPPFAVNGHGSFLSGIPQGDGWRWYAGSTFESNILRALDSDAAHASNQEKLRALLPAAAHALAPQFAQGQAEVWAASRCVSHDRLPLVGPVEAGAQPTLWMSAGMGARGLSFAALCAELLVALIDNEPLPLEAGLVKALHSTRVRRRSTPARTAAVE